MIKKHAIFGTINFTNDNKPYATDLCKMLKIQNLYNSNEVLEIKDVLKLLDKSKIEHKDILKTWLYNQMKSQSNNYIYNDIKDVILSINDDDFITLDVHPISNNELYTAQNNKIITSDKYRNWRTIFPYEQLKAFKHIDFKRPVFAIYKYDHLPSYDVENFNKATSDAITQFFGIDDHQIKSTLNISNTVVSERQQGKIHIFLCNIKTGF